MQKKVERRRRAFGLGDGGENRIWGTDVESLGGGLGVFARCGGACLAPGEPVRACREHRDSAEDQRSWGLGDW